MTSEIQRLQNRLLTFLQILNVFSLPHIENSMRPTRYHDSIADALADLGSTADINGAFTEFQRYLYDDY